MELQTIQKDIDKNLSTLGDMVKATQERIDKLEKSTDAVTKAELEQIGKKSTELEDKIQKQSAARDALKKQVDELEKAKYRFGVGSEEELKNMSKEYDKDIRTYMRKGVIPKQENIDNMLENMIRKNIKSISDEEIPMAKKELSVIINPEGGYLVSPQRLSKMVERSFETSPIRRVASIETTTTDSVELIIDDNEASSGGWIGEKQARTNTDTPEIGKLTIFNHEQFAKPRATQKILDDAGFDIEGWLMRKVEDKFIRTENTAFISGNGVGKPKGFLSYPAWAVQGTYERGKIEQITSATSGTLGADDYIDTQGSLQEIYQPRAVWMMKRSTWTNAKKLKDGQGNYLIDFTLLKDGTDMRMLGKPVIFADDMPAIAGSALSVAYGDFNMGYTIVDRLGIRVLRDPYSAKPYIEFYTTKRVGGDVTNYESIKILKVQA